MGKPKATQPTSDRRAGRISGVFGLRGEVKVDATSAGRSVLRAGRRLRIIANGRSQELRVGAVREHQGRQLVRFDGINDANAARSIVGAELLASRDAFVLQANEYLDEDLIGCRLLDEQRRDLGQVSAVEHYPAQDVLVVGEYRVPLVRKFIRKVDLAARRIRVSLPPGLFD